MIEAKGLTKYFGATPAVKNVSFEVGKGEIAGFLGPNGAGKTTTMRMLTCYFPPTSGTARVAGYDIFKDSLKVRRKIGYFIEKAPLYTDMTVENFLGFAADIRGVSKGEKKKRIGKVMEDCGISNVSHRLINNLSRGYRQRVSLAQNLVHDPEVLILDEPTIGLDPEQVAGVRKLIKNIGTERTVFLSTHILHDVSMVCSKVIIINQGEIIAVDTPENLNARIQRVGKTRVRIDGPPDKVVQQLSNIPDVLNVNREEAHSDSSMFYTVESKKDADIARDITSVVFKNSWGLLEIQPVKMSLEEIFLTIVKGS